MEALDIQKRVETLDTTHDRNEAVRILNLFFAELEKGTVRSAARDDMGVWHAQEWVKKAILAAFKFGVLTDFASGALSFVDKDTLSPRRFKKVEDIRIVPGGSSVRRGAYIGKGVVVMPPSYINVGAYVGDDTMIDSHVLVGSCAQIGNRVHLSAGAQIGGVLEPIGTVPVIIEDEVVVGGNTGIYEGTIVRTRAVIGAGVVITGSTPVYDVVRSQIYRRTETHALEIPYGAVVVPGSRPVSDAFGVEHHLHVSTPVIIKYRDEKTDAATILEEALR